MSRMGDDLVAWEARLAAADASLREREVRALDGEPTPVEVRAFAAEYEKLAADRDMIADTYDAKARRRDATALGRDVRGSRRDEASRDYAGDTGWAGLDRTVAGIDRDLAAGDRSDAVDDRRRASQDRQHAAADRQHARDDADASRAKAEDYEREIAGLYHALETRLLIGQAEGLIMAQYNLSGDAAFRLLVKLSQQTHEKLRDVAARLVDRHEPLPAQIADDARG